MNAYGHGDSSVAAEGRGSEISRATGGMTDAVEYLAALNFLSMPRASALPTTPWAAAMQNATAAYYTGLERQALAAGAAPEDAAAQNKVATALIIGNVPAGLAEAGPYHAELGVIAGRYDEFFIVTLHDSVVQIFQNPITKQLAALQQGTDPVQGPWWRARGMPTLIPASASPSGRPGRSIPGTTSPASPAPTPSTFLRRRWARPRLCRLEPALVAQRAV